MATNLRTLTMNRLLLAGALVLAFSAPVLATTGQTLSKAKQTYVLKRHWNAERAQGGFNRGDPNDPYWEPCLSYQRNWGVGACGGN
jgi:hypothetical protein